MYAPWHDQKLIPQVTAFFSGISGSDAETKIYIPAGVLDPLADPSELDRVNAQIPINVIKDTRDLNVRIVTFGTILEAVEEIENHYVNSKRRLANYVDEIAKCGEHVHHLRIHTVYGGDAFPAPFMFLGHILKALNQQSTFQMTSGRQLREYHHIDDDVIAINTIANSAAIGIREISHGNPIELRELATTIFSRFKQSSRLQIGAISDPKSEIRGRRFQAPLEFSNVSFREASEGCIDYLKVCLAKMDANS